MCLDTSSPSNDSFTSEPASPSPALSNIPTTKLSTNKLQLERPEYTIYADAQIISGSKAESISTEVRHRLTKTMHNTIASCASFNRLPYVSKIEEMAKSLVITYPCLRDAETGHVSNVFFFTYFFFDNQVCYTWRGGILVTINKTLVES